MKGRIQSRTIELGDYITKTNATVRDAAKVFGISKSTVHKDVTERLKLIDLTLYHSVRLVLECNLAERHIRGGTATKAKYQKSHS